MPASCDRSGPAVGLRKFIRQPFEQLACARGELRIPAQVDRTRHGEQCFDGPLM